MANQVEYHNCSLCGVQPFNIPTTNHILHFLISFFSCGLWGFVWVFVAVFKGSARCSNCGLTPFVAYRKAKRKYKRERSSERKAEKRAAISQFNESGPEYGSRAKVTSGTHKGRFGTVVLNDGVNVTIADKKGRKMTLPISSFRL